MKSVPNTILHLISKARTKRKKKFGLQNQTSLRLYDFCRNAKKILKNVKIIAKRRKKISWARKR